MDQRKLDRINELAKISRIRTLTPDEKVEQAELRSEYIEGYKRSLENALSNTYIVDEKGNKKKVEKKHKQ